jgi:hypothetical protein
MIADLDNFDLKWKDRKSRKSVLEMFDHAFLLALDLIGASQENTQLKFANR